MKVNILGTEYEIVLDDSGDNPKLDGYGGYFECYSKKIVLQNRFDNNPRNVENFDEYKASVLRHEITHAFLFESGLYDNSEWGSDETLVDWIALQVPKIVKAMADAKCLGGEYIEKSKATDKKSTKDN